MIADTPISWLPRLLFILPIAPFAIILCKRTWSHSFLTHRFDHHQFDTDFDRKNLYLLMEGQGSQIAEISSEEIRLSGNHVFLNWMSTSGVVGDRPAEIVDQLE